jgi:hypothetical protein
MGKPHSRSERLGKKRNLLLLPEIKRFLGYSVPSLFSVATELFRHIVYLFIYRSFTDDVCTTVYTASNNEVENMSIEAVLAKLEAAIV